MIVCKHCHASWPLGYIVYRGELCQAGCLTGHTHEFVERTFTEVLGAATGGLSVRFSDGEQYTINAQGRVFKQRKGNRST